MSDISLSSYGQAAGDCAIPENGGAPFHLLLASRGLALTRSVCSTLQVNVGYLCNQTCLHCHLEAGPGRGEVMDRQTAEQVVRFASLHRFKVADITGGAVEMCPETAYLAENLRPLADKLIVRINLTAMGARLPRYIGLFRAHNAELIASLPSADMGQTDAQRGKGVFEKSMEVLAAFNRAGYGVAGSGLELSLVANPPGAFLPMPQAQAEARFRSILWRKHGVEFTRLYAFVNAPIGRFRKWLIDTGNYESYLSKIKESFNPCALDGVMCRTMISVGWNGRLYDCDFNQAINLGLGGETLYLADIQGIPKPGDRIATGDHCFSCVAGSGFT